ncbi:Aflatoxin B1 aldehyde reductase member 2 [Fonsecaea pedrosoi]|nr:Aflatoxin B1 aldehyde reductase member 2 [Fonsecaea pedrosoi]
MPQNPSTTATGNKPRVILGLMTFGPPGTEAEGSRIVSIDEYNKCLDTLQSRGYNEVDTARMYIGGAQEAFTREARWKERGLTLATKNYPIVPGDHKPTKLRATLEKSLSELGTSSVDLLYLHAPDRSVPFVDTLRELNKLHQEGKFMKLGLSNFASWEVAEVWNIANDNGWVKPSVYQALYNCITRSIELELIPCCRKFGIDIVIFNPLAGGLFSGKYKSKDAPTEGRFSIQSPIFGKLYRGRYFQDPIFNALAIIQPIAEKSGLTLLETALRWCVHHSALKLTDGNDGIIIGVSSLKQLDSNLTDLEKGPLPEEVVKAIDEAWDSLKSRAANYFH